jgi:chromosome segregation ATPase
MLTNARVQREKVLGELVALQLIDPSAQQDTFKSSIRRLRTELKSTSEQIESLEDLLGNFGAATGVNATECTKLIERGFLREKNHDQLISTVETVVQQLGLYLDNESSDFGELEDAQDQVDELQSVIDELNESRIPDAEKEVKAMTVELETFNELYTMRKNNVDALISNKSEKETALKTARHQMKIEKKVLEQFGPLESLVDDILKIQGDQELEQFRRNVLITKRNMETDSSVKEELSAELDIIQSELVFQAEILDEAKAMLELAYANVTIVVDTITGPVEGSSAHPLADTFRYLVDVEAPEPVEQEEQTESSLTGAKLLTHIKGTLTSARSRYSALHTKISSLKGDLEELKVTIPEAKGFLEAANEVVESVTNDLNASTEILNSLKNDLEKKSSKLVLARPSLLIKQAIEDAQTLLGLMLELGPLSSSVEISSAEVASFVEVGSFSKLLGSSSSNLKEGGKPDCNEPFTTEDIKKWAAGDETNTDASKKLAWLFSSGLAVIKNVVNDDSAFAFEVNESVPGGVDTFVTETALLQLNEGKHHKKHHAPSDDSEETSTVSEHGIPKFGELTPFEALSSAEDLVEKHTDKVSDMKKEKVNTEQKLEDLLELGKDKNSYTAGIKDAQAKIDQLMDDTRGAAKRISSLKGDIDAHEKIVDGLESAVTDGKEWFDINAKAEEDKAEHKLRTEKAKEIVKQNKLFMEEESKIKAELSK